MEKYIKEAYISDDDVVTPHVTLYIEKNDAKPKNKNTYSTLLRMDVPEPYICTARSAADTVYV